MMDYEVNYGVFQPNFELSELERNLFKEFEDLLRSQNFKYLAVPISVNTGAFYWQNMATDAQAYWLDGHHMLNGSAEQGILDYFMCSEVEPVRVYAYTHCFRREQDLQDIIRLKEFKKLEQFIFCEESEWKSEFELVLNNSIEFLNKYKIEHRIVDVTERDPGYHIKKLDIEIKTKQYGWLETHSCSYFGENQTEHMGITGATHSISNTAISSPRILVPFIERAGNLNG